MIKILQNIWPVRRNEISLFVLALSVIILHGVIYTIARSAKVAFVISQGGAKAIPIIQLFALLPATIIVTAIVARLLRRFSHERVFGIIAAGFLILYASFAVWLFPYRSSPIVFSLFWVSTELWKVMLLAVILRGLFNARLEYAMAKRLYAPLGVALGISAFFAGRLTMLCNSPNFLKASLIMEDPWHRSMILMMGLIVCLGIAMLICFHYLCRRLPQEKQEESDPSKISLWSSIPVVIRSGCLRGILTMVLCDYLVYSFAELIFYDILQKAHPDPTVYCSYMGKLSAWGGIGNVFTVLFIAPLLIQKFRWVVPAMITPVTIVIISLCFFGAVLLDAIPLAVFFGSALFCYGRSAKYGLFDPTKELAYIPLAQQTKMRGKLVIDGVAARFGIGVASGVSMALNAGLTTLVATVPYLSAIALVIGAIWIRSTSTLGKLVDANVARIGQEEARIAGNQEPLTVL
ncbi:MAG: hypothetical protein JSR80_03090 [Verrucomicrobia bacterium]|nr:hypothetical protein [Verrucomicrobiota bacterium]